MRRQHRAFGAIAAVFVWTLWMVSPAHADPADPCQSDTDCNDASVCTLNDTCANGFCVSSTGQAAVSAGGSHTCALRPNGHLQCWGNDDYGQVSGPNASTGTYTAVSTGGSWYTCAVRTDGFLACWGNDGWGQVSGPIASAGPYTAISAGGAHTCALRYDGGIHCWGQDGQVSGPNSSPGSYTAISAGETHTCAVRTDGGLDCWGFDAYGQVSGPNGSTDNYAAVSAGGWHTCAIRTDGRLACWGYDGAGNEVSGPNETTERFTAISLGGHQGSGSFTCALRADGRLVCWGLGPYAPGSGPNASTGRYTAVDAGGVDMCALRADGRLACWGGNLYGQTSGPNGSQGFYGLGQLDCDDGNPCTVDSCDPVQGCVHEAGNPGAVCRSSAGVCDRAETCTGAGESCPSDAMEPASVICRPAAGACDAVESCDGAHSACPADSFLAPTAVCRPATGRCNDTIENCTGADAFCPRNQQNVPNGTPCDDGNLCTTQGNDSCVGGFCAAAVEQTSIAAGARHTCALRTDQRLLCWGSDDRCWYDDSGNSWCEWAGQVSGPNGSAESYAAVSAAGDFSCAIRIDGRLACWGDDGDGQVSGPNGSTDSYIAIGTAPQSTCAVRTDGRLSCWGADDFGQVSGPNGSTDSYTTVAAGLTHTCGIGVDGRLACWGYDGYGQVSGPNASTESYTAVGASVWHTCALRADGRLACWGHDGYGQVSGPNASTESFTAVAASEWHTCALRGDGRPACWGYDGYGQVSGPNASTDSYIAIAATYFDTCALRTDGRLTCWGWADYGQVSGPNQSRALFGLRQLDCEDNGVCTDDACDPALGCVHLANTSPCDDGNACTLFDNCSGGACVGASPVTCSAVDPCHDVGVCDPGTGVCSNPDKPDGAMCNDDDLCTTGDACLAGTCTPTFNGLNEPNPRTNGYYRRLCHGPHSGDQLTDDDARCVAAVTTTFAGMTTVAQVCEVLDPSAPNNDTCSQTEDDLMALALNICRARVCLAQGIDSQCGGTGNVGQSLDESDAILGDPSGNHDSCSQAKCLSEEINTGRALELNSLTVRREGSGVRLDWNLPHLGDGSALPVRYNVWRRGRGSLSPFTKSGETGTTTFLDTSAGSGSFEYEVTAVMN